MKINVIVFIVTLVCTLTPANFQQTFNITKSINKFSVDLLAETTAEARDSLNIAISPLTIWTMLSIILEGAKGDTADQLEKVLQQPQNKDVVRSQYVKLTQLLDSKSYGTHFETSNGLFTNKNFPAKKAFVDTIKQYYGVDATPVDFIEHYDKAAQIINEYVAKETKNRIPNLVYPVDVQNAQIFITSTMFFKGQWKVPFNKTATKKDVFYDEKKNKIGEVDMMYQVYSYPFTIVNNLKANAIELPYGLDDNYSMLVILPRGTETIENVLNLLKKDSISNVLALLKQSHERFAEEDVHVYLPRFKITSDFNMDRVLEKMGITDVFNSQKADLLGMFSQYLFLSRVIQKAQIDVDEEGTVATAAAASIFLNRAPPPSFIANKPFIYFIIHKISGSVIFAGKLSNPNLLRQ